jgi:hypothetical protein
VGETSIEKISPVMNNSQPSHPSKEVKKESERIEIKANANPYGMFLEDEEEDVPESSQPSGGVIPNSMFD